MFTVCLLESNIIVIMTFKAISRSREDFRLVWSMFFTMPIKMTENNSLPWNMSLALFTCSEGRGQG